MKTHLPLNASLALLFCSAAHAAVLVNDNFTLSSGTNATPINNTQATGVGAYANIQGAGTNLSVTTVSGFGSGNVLALPANTNTFYRAFNGDASITLSSLAVGETLALDYSIRFNIAPNASVQNFSFGFINTTAANSVVYANLDLSQTNGTGSEFRSRSGSFNMSDAGTFVGAGFASIPLSGGVNYTLGLHVTKESAGYLIEYLRDGAVIGSVSAANNSTWATTMSSVGITGIAFRHSQAPNVTTYIDTVTVTTSAIPEPSAFAAFGGLAALGFAALRRRRAA